MTDAAAFRVVVFNFFPLKPQKGPLYKVNNRGYIIQIPSRLDKELHDLQMMWPGEILKGFPRVMTRPAGRVGSGQEELKISWVESGRVRIFSNTTGRVGSPRSDSTANK